MCTSNFQVKKILAHTGVYEKRIFYFCIELVFVTKNKIVLIKYKIQVKITKITITKQYMKLIKIHLLEFKTD